MDIMHIIMINGIMYMGDRMRILGKGLLCMDLI